MNSLFRTITLLLALLLGASFLLAAATDDIEAHRHCNDCGMDRKAYGYSRVLIVYQDGGEIGLCSLHCAVLQRERDPRPVKEMLVADRETRTLLPVEAASWVVGGDKRGVMTSRPKWAFAASADAAAFVAAHGGAVVTWPEVLRAARADAGLKD